VRCAPQKPDHARLQVFDNGIGKRRVGVDERRVSPEQTLTRAEALRCATHNNAFLSFDEDRKGSLEPGKLADMAVLSADPLTVEEVGIRDVKSLMTMVGGKIVYETPNWFG
jgi:predicted amidohydrolase YtcJ